MDALHRVSDDEALARRLHEELNGGGYHESDTEHDNIDEEMARRLQAEFDSTERNIQDARFQRDAELARRMHAEGHARGGSEDDASLALALQLSDESVPPARERKRRPAASDELTQHLFGGPAPTAAMAAAAAPPIPRFGPKSSSLSYATVAGAGDEQPQPQGSRVVVAPCGSRPTSTSTPRQPLTRSSAAEAITGPVLLIDGANVAYMYGEARGTPSGFDTRGIALCFDYFCNRRPGGGKGAVPWANIFVTLSRSRWDAEDASLGELNEQICWTPVGKDDDVFTIQCAIDHNCWVVTNDRWLDHAAARHATAEVRSRRIGFAWVGKTFTPAADDLARFDGRG
jgi:hypothetical protein